VAGESAPRVIDPRNAWLMDSMLQDVVRRGTGARARSLNRGDIAGKTGTTNDYLDAWFCGYSPNLVAISWMGFSQPKNMGRGETGGAAALPIWINYMRAALKGVPEKSLARPEGLLSAPVADGSVEDFYYAENEPPALKPEPDWLEQLFSSHTPALEAPEEAIPPVAPAPKPAPRPVPQMQPPAPVVDRMPTPIRR